MSPLTQQKGRIFLNLLSRQTSVIGDSIKTVSFEGHSTLELAGKSIVSKCGGLMKRHIDSTVLDILSSFYMLSAYELKMSNFSKKIFGWLII